MLMSAKDCLRKARYKLGLNQKEFANFLNISTASYSLYELGKRQPSFPVIRDIVKRLKEENINIEYTDLRND